MALSIFGGGKPPDAAITTDEGFVDIGLAITQAKNSGGGTLSVVARGTFEGAAIGFLVDIFPDWKEEKVDDSDVVLYWGKACLCSLGQESACFVTALAKLYGVTADSYAMAPRIEATAVGLNTDPRLVGSAPVRLKLFFEADASDRYAEVFVHIDVPGKWLSFNEKDEEYRLPLVLALQLHEGT